MTFYKIVTDIISCVLIITMPIAIPRFVIEIIHNCDLVQFEKQCSHLIIGTVLVLLVDGEIKYISLSMVSGYIINVALTFIPLNISNERYMAIYLLSVMLLYILIYRFRYLYRNNKGKYGNHNLLLMFIIIRYIFILLDKIPNYSTCLFLSSLYYYDDTFNDEHKDEQLITKLIYISMRISKIMGIWYMLMYLIPINENPIDLLLRVYVSIVFVV